MADDGVVPVDEPDSAVGSDLQVRRPKIRIAGVDNRLALDGGEAAALVLHFVLQDALEADDVGDQQIALIFLGEMAAGENFDAGTGAGALLINLRRTGVLLRMLQVAGEQSAVIRIGAGAVVDEILAPAVPNV